jgi:hypothetical protein
MLFFALVGFTARFLRLEPHDSAQDTSRLRDNATFVQRILIIFITSMPWQIHRNRDL